MKHHNDELAALFVAWREDIDSEPFDMVFVPQPRSGGGGPAADSITKTARST